MFGFAPFGSETFASHSAVAIVHGNIENIALTLSLQQKQDLSLQLEYNIVNIPLTINVREPVNLTV